MLIIIYSLDILIFEFARKMQTHQAKRARARALHFVTHCFIHTDHAAWWSTILLAAQAVNQTCVCRLSASCRYRNEYFMWKILDDQLERWQTARGGHFSSITVDTNHHLMPHSHAYWQTIVDKLWSTDAEYNYSSSNNNEWNKRHFIVKHPPHIQMLLLLIFNGCEMPGTGVREIYSSI